MVQLLDGYRRRPAVGVAARFSLDGAAVRAWPKPEAFAAFTGLAAGRHRLRIETRDFFPFECALGVPPTGSLAEGIMVCTLVPGPLYPYPDWDGTIRGRVTRAGRPLAGATITAHYPGRRGQPVSRTTQSWSGGRYAGRYAVSFGDRVPQDSAVTITCVAQGGGTAERRVSLSAGRAVFVDLELN